MNAVRITTPQLLNENSHVYLGFLAVIDACINSLLSRTIHSKRDDLSPLSYCNGTSKCCFFVTSVISSAFFGHKRRF